MTDLTHVYVAKRDVSTIPMKVVIINAYFLLLSNRNTSILY